MRLRVLTVLLVLAGLAGAAQPVLAQSAEGFATAEEFLAMAPRERELYVMGAVDGLASAVYSGWGGRDWILACSQGRSAFEMTNMLVTWLVRNPGQMNTNASSALALAMYELCGQ